MGMSRYSKHRCGLIPSLTEEIYALGATGIIERIANYAWSQSLFRLHVWLVLRW